MQLLDGVSWLSHAFLLTTWTIVDHACCHHATKSPIATKSDVDQTRLKAVA